MKQITEFLGPIFQAAAKQIGPLLAGPTEKALDSPATEHPADASQTETTAAADETARAPSAEPDKTRAAIETKVAAITNLSGDRLSRLCDALVLFHRQADRVRLVRVFAAAEAPPQARKLGEFAFVADFLVQPHQATHGHRDRGSKRGGRRPQEGGRPEAGAREQATETTLTGRFSMDAVKRDRANKLASGGEQKGRRPGGRGGRKPRPASRPPSPSPTNR
jgi:hypothetical protein